MKRRINNIINSINNMSEHNALICVCVLFIASVLIRSANALSIKVIVRYWDELIYYDFAKSLLKTGSFAVRGAPFGFSSVGYSLAILPIVYLFQNSTYVISAICIWNAVLISSSVFPLFLLTKKMIKRRSIQLFTLVLIMSLPIFSISLNVLAESLFFPFSFWIFYLIYIYFDDESRSARSQLAIAIIIGVFLVFLYTIKTLGGVVILSYGLTAIWVIIKRDILNGNKSMLFKDGLCLAASGASFIVAFVLVMKVINSISLENEGDGIQATGSVFSNSLAHLTSTNEYLYFIYAIIMPLGIAIIGMSLFPVILPICDRNNLANSINSYLIFSTLLLLCNSIVVAFTIIIAESPFDIAPVHHYRYCEHLEANFMILTAAVLEGWLDKGDRQEGPFRQRIAIWVGMIGIVIMTTFRFCINGVKWENYGLEWFYKFDTRFPEMEGFFGVSASTMVFRVAVVLAAFVAMSLLLAKRTRWIAVGLMLLVIVTYNWNTNKLFTNIYVGIINNITSTYLDEEMVRIDDYLENIDGTVLIVKDQEFSEDSTVFDTFIFETPYQTSKEQLILSAGADDTVDLKTEPIVTTRFSGFTAYNLYKVDYILSELPDMLDENDAEVVPLEGVKNLYLYRLKDNSRIHIHSN